MSNYPWMNHRVKQMAIARGLLPPAEVADSDSDYDTKNAKPEDEEAKVSVLSGGTYITRHRCRRCFRVCWPAACYTKRGLTLTAFALPTVAFLLIGALLQLDFSLLMAPISSVLPSWTVYVVKVAVVLSVFHLFRINIIKLQTNEYTVSVEILTCLLGLL